ncbi:hypothetical protein SAMN04487970_100743 [Paenibacillus tianmuensis]|uniref:Uncharacterized protein n=1 Tax=Paenibacillus tianmuensis TaxID=624147 RepID=A0A1G4QHI6_9BACL|nr:DUF3168 domain-containing protein [Paenibacillus tianmuensis]SCW43881.1 hypothetical protein SAMN04487970_100743 [Paenibacillus tianmuensis]
MRAEIQARLIEQLPVIAGRCYQLHEINSSTQKPYLVLLQLKEEQEEPWRGLVRHYEVRCYSGMTSFHEVDALMAKVKQALDGQRLTAGGAGSASFTCRYEGMHRSDEVDMTLSALSRSAGFSVQIKPSGGTDSTAAEDPWVEALAKWTSLQLPSEWKVYRNAWPVDYLVPSILWRLTDVEMQDQGSVLCQLKKKITGHVLGRTLAEQNSKAAEMVSKLIGAKKIMLDVANKRYITIAGPALHKTKDEMVEGQVTLTLSRMMDRRSQDDPAAVLIGGVKPNATIE